MLVEGFANFQYIHVMPYQLISLNNHPKPLKRGKVERLTAKLSERKKALAAV